MTNLPAIYPAIAFIFVLALAGLGWCGYYLTVEAYEKLSKVNKNLENKIKTFYGDSDELSR